MSKPNPPQTAGEMMTAVEAKAGYERWLAEVEKLKGQLKSARRMATKLSNEYGRAAREELRENSKPPAGQGETQK
jgi:hypothetical protein